MKRTDKENYYLDIAETVLERSTCLRRKYGAIIVLNDEIIATGYNGAPRGRKNCDDLNYCTRESLKVRAERGTSCAAASMPKPTPSYRQLAEISWGAPFISSAGKCYRAIMSKHNTLYDVQETHHKRRNRQSHMPCGKRCVFSHKCARLGFQ